VRDEPQRLKLWEFGTEEGMLPKEVLSDMNHRG
jgi:hypothetical protein